MLIHSLFIVDDDDAMVRACRFKLCFVHRREVPGRSRRLVAWVPVMKGVALLGCVSQAVGLLARRLAR
jgi:hypothetical protein